MRMKETKNGAASYTFLFVGLFYFQYSFMVFLFHSDGSSCQRLHTKYCIVSLSDKGHFSLKYYIRKRKTSRFYMFSY
jgi:hypothetical protein